MPGETCAEGEECQRNSHCSPETLRCECTDSSKIAIGRTCIDRLKSHPGYPCGNGELCIGNSNCERGTCVCPKNFILKDRICVEPPQGLCFCFIYEKIIIHFQFHWEKHVEWDKFVLEILNVIYQQKNVFVSHITELLEV